MPPTISVLIPAYNAAAYVGEALRSVFGQTCLPEELIVVDAILDEPAEFTQRRAQLAGRSGGVG